MSTPDDGVGKTREFIADAQEIIARTNDLMAALNKLTSKSGIETNLDPRQLAQHARMEEDLAALVQRYFPDSPSSSGKPADEMNSSSASPGNAPVRPGRFRPRI